MGYMQPASEPGAACKKILPTDGKNIEFKIMFTKCFKTIYI
jgi:hypothetical protein